MPTRAGAVRSIGHSVARILPGKVEIGPTRKRSYAENTRLRGPTSMSSSAPSQVRADSTAPTGRLVWRNARQPDAVCFATVVGNRSSRDRAPIGKPNHSAQSDETVFGPWPMPPDRIHSSAPRDGSQNEKGDQCVIRVSEHRYEVGHEVDRRREIREEKPEAHSHRSGDVAIRCKAVDES